jgi:hypothetical protein
MIRFVLLLVILGGLTLLALQNLSPVLPMVFLGSKTAAFPLAVWILVAIALGFCTSLVMAGLFQLSNYVSETNLRSRLRELESGKPRSSQQRRVNVESPSSSSYEENDDDFEFEEDEEEPINDAPKYQDYGENRATYEREQTPKTSSQTGSVYSYGYREPGNSGVGKTESVYDADYRVITPPYRKLDDVETPNQKQNDVVDDWERKSNDDDDDWGFDDDDDFDTPNQKR